MSIMEEIWIIGVGQFGLLALHRLSKSNKERHFVMVDPVKENLFFAKDASQARARLSNIVKTGDLVFLKGSRSFELEKVIPSS